MDLSRGNKTLGGTVKGSVYVILSELKLLKGFQQFNSSTLSQLAVTFEICVCNESKD